MSQERINPKSHVLKERMYQQDFDLTHGRKIKLNMTMQLLDKGIQGPALHLFASLSKLYGTPPQSQDSPPYLPPVEYGPQQYQLTKAVARRVATLSGKELEQFKKGGYIGIGCEVVQTINLGNAEKKM